MKDILLAILIMLIIIKKFRLCQKPISLLLKKIIIPIAEFLHKIKEND